MNYMRFEEQERDYEELVCSIADMHDVDFLKAEIILDKILFTAYEFDTICGFPVLYCQSLRDYYKNTWL